MTDRFRHRSPEIEAVQWTGSNADILTAFAPDRFATAAPEDRIDPEDDAVVLIEESHWVAIRPGCWVLKHPDHFDVESDADFRAGWAVTSPDRQTAVLRDFLWRLEQSAGDAATEKFLDDNPELQRLAAAAAVPAGQAPATGRGGLREQIAEALIAWTYRGKDPEHGGILETVRANAYSRADAVLAVLPTTTDRAAKAEALLLKFAAEAHRRKWAYDRGLDDDGVPIKSEAFDALHRLGEEMRVELEKLRRVAAEAGPADTTTQDSGETTGDVREWCKCRSCWGWFVQEHPGEDLDELGKDLGWWSGLPVHRDAPAGAQQPKEADNPRTVCICGHTRGEHGRVGGPFGRERLLCDSCDPDSTENLTCEEFEAL